MSSARSNTGVPQEDEVKRAADLREWLEAKILELEDELGKHREMLAIVDSVLRKTSFVPATELRTQQQEDVVKPGVQPEKSSVQRESVEKQGSKAPPMQKVSKNGVPSQDRATPVAPAETANSEESRSLRRSKDGKLLASAFVSPGQITIVPSSDVKLTQTTPPFQSFFLNRILKGYESRDLEMAQSGSLQSSEVLKYEVAESEGHIDKIIVKNYRDKSRLNEILNTVTWAFSRMLEKK